MGNVDYTLLRLEPMGVEFIDLENAMATKLGDTFFSGLTEESLPNSVQHAGISFFAESPFKKPEDDPIVLATSGRRRILRLQARNVMPQPPAGCVVECVRMCGDVVDLMLMHASFSPVPAGGITPVYDPAVDGPQSISIPNPGVKDYFFNINPVVDTVESIDLGVVSGASGGRLTVKAGEVVPSDDPVDRAIAAYANERLMGDPLAASVADLGVASDVDLPAGYDWKDPMHFRPFYNPNCPVRQFFAVRIYHAIFGWLVGKAELTASIGQDYCWEITGEYRSKICHASVSHWASLGMTGNIPDAVPEDKFTAGPGFITVSVPPKRGKSEFVPMSGMRGPTVSIGNGPPMPIHDLGITMDKAPGIDQAPCPDCYIGLAGQLEKCERHRG